MIGGDFDSPQRLRTATGSTGTVQFQARQHRQRLQKHRPGASIELLRKLIAITLLALFGLPFASSLLALTPKSDSGLPACCRRLGKHRCSISAQQRVQSSSSKAAIAAPQNKCPYYPTAMLGSTHPTVFGLPKAHAIVAESAAHPAGIPQTESRRRISLDRGRGKRGPPAVSLL
jgi:hypothetical protein